MRIDGKKGAGIPVEVPAKEAAVVQSAPKSKRGRPSKGGKPSAYMLKKYGQAAGDKTTAPKSVAVAKTIHNVIILDKSSSMQGSKYKGAMEGVSLNHRALGFEIASNPGLNYVCTYMLFSSVGQEDWIYKGAAYTGDITKDIDWSNRQYAGGMTALHDAIYHVGEYLKGATAPKTDQVLINIFTDGGENVSQGPIKPDHKAKAYIKELQEKYGFTVTFVGTDQDVSKMVSSLGIDRSNSLAYDGTGEGLSRSMASNIQSRAAYSKSVLEGQDVSKNFYSKTLTHE